MTTTTDLKSFVDRIPKIELHAHLNGCVRESTLMALAKERGIQLSEHHFADDTDDTVGQVVADLEALRLITWEALHDFASHHVVYLELRSTPKRLRRTWKSDEITTKTDYVNVILSVIQDFERQEQERYERERENVGETNGRLPLKARLLVSIDRARDVEEAIENVNIAIDLHQNENPYIVGIDLGGNPLRNDFRDFEGALSMARKAGLKVTLHCGEVACAERNNDPNPAYVRALEEAHALIAFHPDRLGHALLLPASIRPALSSSKIPVETCPTSNVMTLELATSFHGHLVEGLKAHPQMEHWLSTDYPFSVSTDDSGVFNTNPSKELLLLSLAWNLSPGKLTHIVMRSIEHAFCDENLKALLRKSMLPYFELLPK
ncbi:Adenosine/AMP deaminase [Fragilaria crotonensis]|nr:Adenosine/AMP deaminase [Fragilaria crotonensis]